MADQETPPQKRKGCLRRLFGFCIRTCLWLVFLSVLLFSSYVGWVTYQGEQALSYVQTELAKRDIKREKFKAISAEKNAARYWLAAMEITRTSLHFPYDEFDWPEFGIRIDPKASVAFGKCVALNEATEPLIKQAKKIEQCRFYFNMPQDTYKCLTFWSNARKLARTLEAKVYYAISIHDPQMAVDACLDNWALYKALASLEPWIGQHVRVSIAYLIMADIQTLLGSVELTETQIQQLVHSMSDGLLIDLQAVVKDELLEAQSYALYPQWELINKQVLTSNLLFKLQKQYPFMDYHYRFNMNLIDSAEPYIPPKQYWWDRLGLAGLNAFGDLTVAQKQADLKQKFKFYIAMYDACNQEKLTWQKYQTMLDNHGYNEAPRYLFFYRCESEWIVCQTGLAIELYRIKHDAWPASLKQIADDIPLDAFGNPLIYAQTEDGVMVYSYGSNGVDDLGGCQPATDDQPAKDNFVFKLLNVNQRNQEPKPKHKSELELPSMDALPVDGKEFRSIFE